MALYRVTYEIDVDADSVEDAALQVEETMKNPTFRPSLNVVCEEKKECVNIDLEIGYTIPGEIE